MGQQRRTTMLTPFSDVTHAGVWAKEGELQCALHTSTQLLQHRLNRKSAVYAM